ncbi:hypothetical protein D934_10700 [Xylella fastidiosa subsp. sandyi Ann-1]|uniref:Uncharacterized protein n=1 Tax=Xylella fastidiosa subsp. sandyi Ann-1 TaxID=155920 RepID=A0A060H7I1_XYLFS|nr:hypothetical protein D934_10700 [Xylella fastidiosa subsp. sandyi Ann-1]KAF0570815.1 hypothetical protein P305_07930 [Xylella fastidiosa subsp. fastidiosa Mus-1]
MFNKAASGNILLFAMLPDAALMRQNRFRSTERQPPNSADIITSG